jgi:nucleoside-diphosphate-sugar epimerase
MILVTGGSGFVGLNLAEQLLSRGESIALFSATPAPPSAIAELSRLPGKLSVLGGDVSDFPSVKDIFEQVKPQRVIHAAAITAGAERDAREPRRIAQVNLIGTINVLEAARDAGVRRFVHASTGAVFGAAGMGAAQPLDEERDRPLPESLYGITKYAAERSVLRLASLWKMDAVAGRLAVVFGRWEYATGVRDTLAAPTLLARIARQGGEAVFPALGDTDYIYGPDVAAALIALLDAKTLPHRLYHLGNGAPWSLPHWCAALGKRFPRFRWRESTNADECNVSVLPSVSRKPFSNRRLVEDLGYAPRYDLEAAAADFTSWLGEHDDF